MENWFQKVVPMLSHICTYSKQGWAQPDQRYFDKNDNASYDKPSNTLKLNPIFKKMNRKIDKVFLKTVIKRWNTRLRLSEWEIDRDWEIEKAWQFEEIHCDNSENQEDIKGGINYQIFNNYLYPWFMLTPVLAMTDATMLIQSELSMNKLFSASAASLPTASLYSVHSA